MTKEENRKRIADVGIIPVVRASSAHQALLAVEAIRAGGISIVEVTMTVPGAIEVIGQLAKTAGGDVLIGAGTVLDAKTAQQCLDAGAEFLVSPGFDAQTVKLAREKGILVIPGALTPTEIITAWNAGGDLIKIFPCGAVGGAKYIKALKGPLPQVPVIPTGGVNFDTAADFILAGAEALGVGGELVSASALKSGKTNQITEAARRFVAIVREARQRNHS
ncbi:MAG TPA: bifunctional 4-hydroxy-2-oxoglutarate aldolase/2-dehydro-3-deoxy-phosphogluconate aldolase [Candidatus Sulfotelmatobacter sp.]|jgi:2-dehydro-3-deoxyphosphogluconate aldolase / (4S)-4-hydroxy-2-oxoglutarate aldolase|nr:bifunctional 4-hydroxy-2-oxoglutarate aldolase/2-dehydro-3-deoxy-phosphogluconate aldolase [Candidatus Sulfotelmatobacter sp.]